jgi:hypothetical protein
MQTGQRQVLFSLVILPDRIYGRDVLSLDLQLAVSTPPRVYVRE